MNNQTGSPNDIPLKQVKSKPPFTTPFLGAFLLIAAALSGAVYYWQHSKVTSLNRQISKYEQLVSVPNQACIGLGVASGKGINIDLAELNGSQFLYNNDSDGRTAVYACKIGINTKAATKGLDVAQVDRNGYEMGAEVTYFKTQTEAEKYADKKVNPLRYWSVLHPVGNISQETPFTSIIFGKPVYFDSYTVKGVALVRISLPCGSVADSGSTSKQCPGYDSKAESILESFAKSIKQLNF
jgi:hypothetical protein